MTMSHKTESKASLKSGHVIYNVFFLLKRFVTLSQKEETGASCSTQNLVTFSRCLQIDPTGR